MSIHIAEEPKPLDEPKAVDENHPDAEAKEGFAPEPPQGYRLVQIDPATEARVRHKLDRVVVTIVFLLYLVAFLDRSNIGNAQTAGMGKDLGMSDSQYQVGLSSAPLPMGGNAGP